MTAPVVHFEIISKHSHPGFYESVFGWQADRNNPAGYGTISAEQTGISGGMGAPYESEEMPYATVYVAVPDINEALEAAQQAGGSIALSKREFFPGGPTIAQLADPDGVRIGLLERPA
ncbi:MAG: VOC family protein [Pseudomonadota bacterium]